MYNCDKNYDTYVDLKTVPYGPLDPGKELWN